MPNASAVTQEANQNYGKFKLQFHTNLVLIVDNHLEMEQVSVSLQPWIVVPPVVFCCEDPVTKYKVVENAFQVGFSWDKYKCAWEKVGAALLT